MGAIIDTITATYDAIRGVALDINTWTWDHPWAMLTVPAIVGTLFLVNRNR